MSPVPAHLVPQRHDERYSDTNHHGREPGGNEHFAEDCERAGEHHRDQRAKDRPAQPAMGDGRCTEHQCDQTPRRDQSLRGWLPGGVPAAQREPGAGDSDDGEPGPRLGDGGHHHVGTSGRPNRG